MAYDATKREDIGRLALNLATTPSADYWKVLGHVYGDGLMRFRGPVHWLLVALRKVRGPASVFAFFSLMQKHSPDFVKQCMLDTIEHVVTGTDREDPKSFGGWSQREVDLFSAKVSFSNDGVTK